MWLDQADGLSEIFRGYLPYYLLVFFPIFIILSPVNPVAASHEFSVYRMQQYDLHSVPHGCRSASFNLEGRSLSSWGTSRHCVVARIQDISIEQLYEIRNKAGALLLVLPSNVTLLSDDEKEHIRFVELALTQQEINIPVYFAEWSPEYDCIIADLQHSIITDEKSGSALEAMMNTVSSNGYQIVVSAPTPQKIESKPVTLHGKLMGRSTSAQTIVVAAHYDAAGAVPELAFGADSNASGAVALLELARVFSRLYSTGAVRGAPSILFVLASTGHSLNYFATKKWLEDQLDSADASLLQDISFVMCLDTMSSGPLSMHVSKPPKPGTPAHSIRARLDVEVVHKKINLADELLAWHHERFSIRRMTAFTLSALKSHKEAARSSVLDSPNEAALRTLTANIRDTARALASHVYNLTDEDAGLYDNALNVDETFIRTWYNYLASQPRAPQMLAAAPNTAGVTSVLERALSQFVTVTSTTHAPDRREPEHVLYGPTRALLYVYSVKPAVFDLILTLVIVAYLTVIYFAMQIFPRFYEEYFKIVTGKVKVN